MRTLLLSFALAAVPATAQNLPSWAAPAESAPAEASQFAPPCPPGQTDTGSGCVGDPPAQVPLDGGLGLLALAGGAYAARRLRRA